MQRFTSLNPLADLPQIIAQFNARRQPLRGEGEKQATWYAITNVSQEETEVFIYDEIGLFGVTAGDFVNDLRAIKARTITLRINSPGGDVFDGLAIYNAIRRHSSEVNVFVDGIAASAASFIAMAGDTITMSPHAQMMIHDANGLVIGNADDMRKMADLLDMNSDNIAAIYAERAGGTVPEWRARMQDETWLSDQETVDLGLADGIDGDEEEVENKVQTAPVFPDLTDIALTDLTAIKPEPVDFKKLFEDITQANEEELYASVA